NLDSSLTISHLMGGLLRRVWFLFLADGHWIGSLALFAGFRVFHPKTPEGRSWSIAFLVAAIQIAIVTTFGGALLERYLLPVLPILYAAFAAGLSAFPAHWRMFARVGLILLLVAGWFWNPPYPFPFENNLSMINFVRLQQDAAAFLEASSPGRRV